MKGKQVFGVPGTLVSSLVEKYARLCSEGTRQSKMLLKETTT